MKLCPHCAAPVGPSGCPFCQTALSAEQGVGAQWHISSRIDVPPPVLPRFTPRAAADAHAGVDDPRVPGTLAHRLAAKGLQFPERAPNCYDCRAFSITHDKGFPRGCHTLEFKGKELPSHFLFNVTGRNCPWFDAREAPA